MVVASKVPAMSQICPFNSTKVLTYNIFDLKAVCVTFNLQGDRTAELCPIFHYSLWVWRHTMCMTVLVLVYMFDHLPIFDLK